MDTDFFWMSFEDTGKCIEVYEFLIRIIYISSKE